MGEHTKGVDPDCNITPRRKYCTAKIQTIPVESYVIHADYNQETKEDDIALIRLARDADTTKGILKINSFDFDFY